MIGQKTVIDISGTKDSGRLIIGKIRHIFYLPYNIYIRLRSFVSIKLGVPFIACLKEALLYFMGMNGYPNGSERRN